MAPALCPVKSPSAGTTHDWKLKWWVCNPCAALPSSSLGAAVQSCALGHPRGRAAQPSILHQPRFLPTASSGVDTRTFTSFLSTQIRAQPLFFKLGQNGRKQKLVGVEGRWRRASWEHNCGVLRVLSCTALRGANTTTCHYLQEQGSKHSTADTASALVHLWESHSALKASSDGESSPHTHGLLKCLPTCTTSEEKLLLLFPQHASNQPFFPSHPHGQSGFISALLETHRQGRAAPLPAMASWAAEQGMGTLHSRESSHKSKYGNTTFWMQLFMLIFSQDGEAQRYI